jgi:hypothetical protein
MSTVITNPDDIIVCDDETLPKYRFSKHSIRDWLNNWLITDEQILAVVNILAANIEGDVETNEIVELVRENFNDGFHDMQEDLREDYGNP